MSKRVTRRAIMGLLLLLIGIAMFIWGGFIFQVYACAGGALCHPSANELLLDGIVRIAHPLGFLLMISGIIVILLSRHKLPTK